MGLNTVNKRASSKPATVGSFLAALLCLVFTGCYQTNQEVITSSVAEVLPYNAEKVSLQADGDMFIKPSTTGHDYKVRYIKPNDPDVKTGTLRVMRVKGNIFAVQTKYDGENFYDILFCKITANNYQIMEPVSDEAVHALAHQNNVNLTMDIKTGNDLSGNPHEILNFLKAHKDLKFREFKETTPPK